MCACAIAADQLIRSNPVSNYAANYTITTTTKPDGTVTKTEDLKGTADFVLSMRKLNLEHTATEVEAKKQQEAEAKKKAEEAKKKAEEEDKAKPWISAANVKNVVVACTKKAAEKGAAKAASSVWTWLKPTG